MAWPTLVPPTAGTVITVAREVAMNNDPLNWLRLMTGNADPPGPNYVVVSVTTASTVWGKVTGDVLSPGAAIANLGYTPLNKAGDTTLSDLTVSRQSTGVSSDGVLLLGQTGGAVYLAKIGTQIILTGAPIVLNNTTSIAGNVSATGTATIGAGLGVTGDVSIARAGAAAATGVILLGNAGHFIGWVSPTGFVVDNNLVWHQGNDGNGSGLDADLWRGLPPSLMTVGAATNATNAVNATNATNAGNASTLGGFAPSNVPAANTVPVVPAGGTLDAWVTPTSAAPVPSGLIAFIATASLPAGWTFYTALNGRVLVGAGTASVTNAQTFTVFTNYGPDWAHGHTVNVNHAHGVSGTHQHGATALGVGGTIGAPTAVNGLASAGGVNLPTDTHGHSHSLDVTGTTDAAAPGSTDAAGSTTQATTNVVWIPPSHALNAIIKT